MSFVAAPEYVPRPKDEQVRVYESPPWRSDPWLADRPADLGAGQPVGPGFGWQGPDQGYALLLARRAVDRLVLEGGENAEDLEDTIQGCLGVALKRASMYRRAPVIHDLNIAFTVWGFLDEAPAELVDLRRPIFWSASHPHHEEARQRITDMVPEETLRLTPGQVRERFRSDWRSLLDLSRVA